MGDLQNVAPGTLAYVLDGQVVRGDDVVVDVLPCVDRDVAVHLFDTKAGHRASKASEMILVNGCLLGRSRDAAVSGRMERA